MEEFYLEDTKTIQNLCKVFLKNRKKPIFREMLYPPHLCAPWRGQGGKASPFSQAQESQELAYLLEFFTQSS